MKQGELPGPWVEGKTSERETIRLVNALRSIAAREFHLEFFETTVLTAAPAMYKAYFLDNEDYARFRNQPRFQRIIGSV